MAIVYQSGFQGPRGGFQRGSRRGEDRVRINHEIRVPNVRLVDEEGNQIGVVDLRTALQKAEETGLDLVEVASNTDPPVCRIMDYSKYRYEQEKKQKLAKKKQHTTHMKEVRFNPKIEEHDYQVKITHIKEFLSYKDKVRVVLRFRGRETAHRNIGMELLRRIANDVAVLGEMESEPKSFGSKMVIMTLNPKG